jgi:hypothetical protein
MVKVIAVTTIIARLIDPWLDHLTNFPMERAPRNWVAFYDFTALPFKADR